MKLFLKEQLGLIFAYTFNFIFLLSIYFIFGGFNTISNVLYFIFLSIFILIIYITINYFNNKKFYKIISTEKINSFEEVLNSFDNSYLGNNMNKYTSNLYNIYQYNIHLNIKKHKDHLDFINQWIHQMKTPISVINLVLQENSDLPQYKYLKSEVDKLQKGLDIALYNARLETFEHDFKVTKFNLSENIKNTINSLKGYFIKNKVFPKTQLQDDLTINSDSKWINFILEQLLINAIKYSKNKGKFVYINAYKKNNQCIVEIKDEGIGISKKDIRRVFEPFYTGENGRILGESTGMGLYLVNEVIKKLNHSIDIQSKEQLGTVVTLIF